MSAQVEIYKAIASLIRETSSNGRLVSSDGLLVLLKAQGLANPEDLDSVSQFTLILSQVIAENEDILEIFSSDYSVHYYSSLSMSQTYAGILAQNGDNSLMAAIVRENSALYPRPVPLDMFSEPPFDMTQEQISECLERMGKPGEYQDVAQTITSIGTVFLYSSLHMEGAYASTLAEWLDVGQANNP